MQNLLQYLVCLMLSISHLMVLLDKFLFLDHHQSRLFQSTPHTLVVRDQDTTVWRHVIVLESIHESTV